MLQQEEAEQQQQQQNEADDQLKAAMEMSMLQVALQWYPPTGTPLQLRLVQEQRLRRAELPPEPPAGPSVAKLQFGMPTGERVTRRFEASNTVQVPHTAPCACQAVGCSDDAELRLFARRHWQFCACDKFPYKATAGRTGDCRERGPLAKRTGRRERCYEPDLMSGMNAGASYLGRCQR